MSRSLSVIAPPAVYGIATKVATRLIQFATFHPDSGFRSCALSDAVSRSDEHLAFVSDFPYSEIVGSLLYLGVVCRPENAGDPHGSSLAAARLINWPTTMSIINGL